MADAPRYRQLGNAVTVNVAEWIANNLVRVYTADKESHDG
jgi:site-specific DNA-cytosine methylase